MGETLIRNERTKLTAVALNNVAVASIVAGTLSPVVGMAYGLAAPHRGGWVTALLSVFWIGSGACLHMAARAVLGRLVP
jgi:hypothetical protein